MIPAGSPSTAQAAVRQAVTPPAAAPSAQACAAAFDRWRSVQANSGAGLLVAVAFAALAALDKYARNLARPATLDGHHLLPRMRQATWFRMAQLQTARAEDAYGRARPGPRGDDPPSKSLPRPDKVDAIVRRRFEAKWEQTFCGKAARQMIEFLGLHATEDGRIDNVGKMIACYRKAHDCSEETAYRHWRVMWQDLGLVRQTQHSAPYRSAIERPDGTRREATRNARYVLCWPSARLPKRLPAESDSPLFGPLDRQAAAWDEHAEASLTWADGFKLYVYGSCRTAQTCTDDQVEDVRSYYCQAFPLYARVSPPSPRGPSDLRDRAGLSRSRPGGLNEEDEQLARGILSRCRPLWAEQLEQLPAEKELAQLTGMIALVLRYSAHVGPSDVVELLTDRVGSARDLVGLLRFRLQTLLNQLRRRSKVAVDEDGSHAAAKASVLAELRAELAEATGATRAEARAEMHHGRARAAGRRRQEQAERAARLERMRACWPPAAPLGGRAEPDPSPQVEEVEVTDVLSAADIAGLRQAMTNTRRALGITEPTPPRSVHQAAGELTHLQPSAPGDELPHETAPAPASRTDSPAVDAAAAPVAEPAPRGPRPHTADDITQAHAAAAAVLDPEALTLLQAAMHDRNR